MPAALTSSFPRSSGETRPRRAPTTSPACSASRWTSPTATSGPTPPKTGGRKRASLSLSYTGNTTPDGKPDPANDLATPVPTKGIVNYPDHIQPLWSRDRGANTCTSCHNSAAKLDLSGTRAGTGRLCPTRG